MIFDWHLEHHKAIKECGHRPVNRGAECQDRITHRLCVNWGHHAAATDTIEWLDGTRGGRRAGRPRIPYRDICFIGDKPDVGADLYIDDAPHNVEGLRSAGRRCIVFDASYNHHVPGPRARNWDEAYELVRAAIDDPERPLPGEEALVA